jgi:hypothetical protein
MIETLNPLVGYHEVIRYKEAVREYGYQAAKREYPEIRRLLQVLGTDIGREMIDPDLWVNLAWEKAKKYPSVCFSDLRFPNEAKLVKDNGGYIICLIREDIASDHPSETEIASIDANWTIDNRGTLQELYDSIDEFMRRIL